jgi:hypothetical protein
MITPLLMTAFILTITCLILFIILSFVLKCYHETKKELEKITNSRDYYKLRYDKYASLRGNRNTNLDVSHIKSIDKQEAIKIVSEKIMAICVNRPKNTQSKHYYYQNGLLDVLEYFCKLIAKIS